MTKIVRENLVSYYADFFLHDVEGLKRALNDKGYFHFIWCVRECGTHLIDVNVSKADKENQLSYLASLTHSYGEHISFYEIKGEGFSKGKYSMKRITSDMAKECVLSGCDGIKVKPKLSSKEENKVRAFMLAYTQNEDYEWYVYQKDVHEQYLKEMNYVRTTELRFERLLNKPSNTDNGTILIEDDYVVTTSVLYGVPMELSFKK